MSDFAKDAHQLADERAGKFGQAFQGAGGDVEEAAPRLGPSPVRKGLDYLILTLVAVVWLGPIYYMVIGSLKPSRRGPQRPRGVPADQPLIRQLLRRHRSVQQPRDRVLLDFYMTSIIVSVVIVVGGLIVNSTRRLRPGPAEVARPQPRADGRSCCSSSCRSRRSPCRCSTMLNDYRNTYLRPVHPVHRERVLDLPLLHVLHRHPEGRSRRPRASTARVPGRTFFSDRRADVQARVRVGDDPVVPRRMGLVPVSPLMVIDQPQVRPLPLGDRGLQGATHRRLGPDLRLRRAAGPPGPGRVPRRSSAGSSRASHRPASRAEERLIHGNHQVREDAQGLPRRHRGDSRLHPRRQGRRVHGVRRTVRVRQVHGPAHDRGSRGDHRRAALHRRRAGQRQEPAGPRHRDGLPGLRAVPAHDRGARTWASPSR